MNKQEWVAKCQHWKKEWSNDYRKNNDTENGINLYSVIEVLNDHSDSNDIFMCDAGSMSYICPVTLDIKGNQKLISSPAQADMGWVLPASIGVALNTDRRVIVLVGDGSFMSNIQELSVIKYHNLNVKFVVLNNNGYLSIRNTQTKFFEGRIFGTGNGDGMWFPEFSDIANSFGLAYTLIDSSDKLHLLNDSTFGPHIIECVCDPTQEIIPAQALKNGAQCGLHDMYPFLPENVLESEMLVNV